MRWEWTDLVKQREREKQREVGEGWRDGGMEGGGARLFTPVCVEEEAGSEEESGGEDAGCSDGAAGDSLCVTLKPLSVSWREEKEQQHICVKVRQDAPHTLVYLRLLELFMWRMLIVGF